jgi:hypothetical protein
MSNIPQYVCFVIPPHILTRVAERTDDLAGGDARATLEHMRELATGRARTLIEGPSAAPPDPSRKRRNVYDARQQHRLPGKLAMSEHKPRGADVEVNEAYDGSGGRHGRQRWLPKAPPRFLFNARSLRLHITECTMDTTRVPEAGPTAQPVALAVSIHRCITA